MSATRHVVRGRTEDGAGVHFVAEVVLAIDYDQLAFENKMLREALKDVHYRVESARVWNGMGWTFTGVHPGRQETILKLIDEVLSANKEK